LSDPAGPTDAGNDPAAERARTAALAAIDGGWASIPGADAAILSPAPIREPDGESIAGWFVGVIQAGLLKGFIQLRPDFEFDRSSTFGVAQDPGDWFDIDRIRERAGTLAGSGDEAGTPYLSYDVTPERIGWIVPIRGPGGRQRRVMVVGSAAFVLESSPSETG
jgi:hypothetical protein